MTRLLAAVVAAFGLCAGAASAQSFPSRPVHVVVPWPAGGAADLIARSIADALAERWRQPVVVENRPGAGSIVATQQVQRATADGTTLLMVAPSFVVNPMVNSEARYDALKDFAPVTLLATSPVVLAVNPASPARTLKELLELARTNPGTMSYAAVGPHTTQEMIGEMLRLESHADWVFAPYPGGAPAVTAVLGNHVAAVIANYSEVATHVSAGKLRVLAVGSPARLEELKDVPTLSELGHSVIDGTIWFGIVAPAGTPRAVVERIRADMQHAVTTAAVRGRLLPQHLYPSPPGDSFAAFLAAQSQRYGVLVRQAGLKN